MKSISRIRNIFRKDFVKDFSILLSGTVLASVLPLLFSPFISRLFTPEQFGVFGIVTAVAGTVGNIAGGRYELAVMLPKKDVDSKHLVFLVLILSVVFSLVISALVGPFYYDLIRYFEIEQLGEVGLIIPLIVIFISIQKAFTYWLNRNRYYRSSASGKVIQGLAVSSFTLLLGVLSVENGLVIGFTIGWGLFVASLAYFSVRKGFGLFRLKASQLKKVAKDYSSFPKWNMIFTFLNDSASYLVIFLITAYFTVEETGYYNFSRQYLFMPLSLISIALSNVYFQRMAQKVKERDSLKKEYFGVLKLLLSGGIIVTLVIYFAGADLFEFIFGGEWRFSGTISKVLIFGFVIKFVASPFGQVLVVLQKLKRAILFPVLYLALMVSLSFFQGLSFERFLLILVIFEVVSYAFYLGLSFYSLREYESKLINVI